MWTVPLQKNWLVPHNLQNRPVVGYVAYNSFSNLKYKAIAVDTSLYNEVVIYCYIGVMRTRGTVEIN